MPAIPQKIRSGLVELRTNRGPLYVSPSVWQRIYLLWTFRNFHRLPQQVLNKRERQLVEKLSRSALVVRQGAMPTRPLIGSVENVEVAGVEEEVEKEALARSGELVTMKPRTAVGRAVGSDSIPVVRNRGTASPIASFPARPTAGESKSASPAHVQRPSITSPKPRDRTYTTRRHLLGALLATGCIALAVVVFHLREGRHISATWQPVLAPNTVQSPSSPGSHLTEPAVVAIPKTAEHTPPVVSVALRTDALAGSAGPLQKLRSANPLTQNSPAAGSLAPDLPHVEESPKVFTYPTAPNSAAQGKVTLRAVVGTEGTVNRIDVLSGSPLLAKAASRAVRHWRYAPYEVNGKAVEAETDVVINFLGDEVVSVSFAGPD